MTPPDKRNRDALFEEVLSAYRPRTPRGGVRPSSAFFDLEAEDRLVAFDETLWLRTIEAAVDDDGQSTTVKTVLRVLSR